MLTSEKEKGSMLCHILSLYNPLQPNIKPINCYSQFFNSFIFERHIPVINSIITFDPDISHKRYDLTRCTNRQFVSTLHKCDGHKDCSDETDEFNCYCFKNSQMIIDNIYCSKTC